MATERYEITTVTLEKKQKAIVGNWHMQNIRMFPSNGFSAALRYIIDDWAELTGNQPPTAEAEAEGHIPGLA